MSHSEEYIILQRRNGKSLTRTHQYLLCMLKSL